MSMSVESGSGKGASQDFDLNIAPIIDCFTVLITFMLASASFMSIGILDAGAGNTAPSADQKPPEVSIELELQPNFTIQMKLGGKTNSVTHLPSKNGSWDFEKLSQELRQIKSQWPQVDTLTLTATNDIKYLSIVETMESVKAVIPGIVLGGF